MVPLITDNLDAIIRIARAHHVKSLYVFGSATGHGIDGNEFGPDSDVDFLVEFTDIIYDFENFDAASNYFDLVDQLEALLGRRVDLVNRNTITRPRVKQYIEQQKQFIYAA